LHGRTYSERKACTGFTETAWAAGTATATSATTRSAPMEVCGTGMEQKAVEQACARQGDDQTGCDSCDAEGSCLTKKSREDVAAIRSDPKP